MQLEDNHLGHVHQVRVFRVGIQTQQKSVEHDAQDYHCLEDVRLDQRPRLLEGAGIDASMGQVSQKE